MMNTIALLRKPSKIISPLSFALLVVALLLTHSVTGQQISKIQLAVNSIKQTYYCEDQDYHTDGQRTVWVKSYKKWIPEDLAVMKKETPATLRFLGMAAQKTRYDVLEQLLPDYYRTHGGAKAFANDILKERPVSSGR